MGFSQCSIYSRLELHWLRPHLSSLVSDVTTTTLRNEYYYFLIVVNRRGLFTCTVFFLFTSSGSCVLSFLFFAAFSSGSSGSAGVSRASSSPDSPGEDDKPVTKTTAPPHRATLYFVLIHTPSYKIDRRRYSSL